MTRVFTLPVMPPTANNCYANVPGKGRRMTQEYKNWRSAAQWTLKAQGARVVPGDYRLIIEIGPRKAGADCTNRLKPIEDSLVGIAVVDDRFTAKASIEWAPIEGVRITIEDAAS